MVFLLFIFFLSCSIDKYASLTGITVQFSNEVLDGLCHTLFLRKKILSVYLLNNP